MAQVYGSYPTSLLVFDQIFSSKAEMEKPESPKPFLGRYAYVRYTSEPLDDQTKYILHTYADENNVKNDYGEDSVEYEYWKNYKKDGQTSFDCTIWRMNIDGYLYITRIDSAGLASSNDIEYIITGGTSTGLTNNGFLSAAADDYWYSFEESSQVEQEEN